MSCNKEEKKTEDLAADSLILGCKIIVSEYGLPRNIDQMQAVILFQKNLKNSPES